MVSGMPTEKLEKLGGIYFVDDNGKFKKLADVKNIEVTSPEIIEGTDGEHDYVFEGSGDKRLLRVLMDAMGIREK